MIPIVGSILLLTGTICWSQDGRFEAGADDFLWTFEDGTNGASSTSLANGGNRQLMIAIIGSYTNRDAAVGDLALNGFGATASDQPHLTNAYSQMTMLFWVKKINPTGPQFAHRSSGGTSVNSTGSFWAVFNGFSPTFRFVDASGSVHTAHSGFNVTSGGWTHVALTIDGGLITFYSNAVEISSSALGASTIPAALPLSRFNLNPTVWSFVDDFALYNQVLTTNQIQFIYKNGLQEFNGSPSSGLTLIGLAAVVGLLLRRGRPDGFRDSSGTPAV